MTGAPDSGNMRREALLDSTLDSVDTAEAMVVEMATAMEFQEDEIYQLGMAVRESMVNAVVHGNRYSANKKVHFRIEAQGDQLTVVIGDEGAGFDPAAMPDPLADENLLRQSGRGILLIEAFVDQFQIQRRSPTGMEVRLTKSRTRG
jgi:serine/threonine-protein kinase RsbW